MAQATTGYAEGDVTKSGISFAHFLISVGVQGLFELSAPQSQTTRPARQHKHRRHPSPTTTVATPVSTGAPGSSAGASAVSAH